MYDGDIAKRHAGGTEYPSGPGRWADEIEQHIIRAYFRLVRATGQPDRPGWITVAKLGPLEVRLTRVPGRMSGPTLRYSGWRFSPRPAPPRWKASAASTSTTGNWLPPHGSSFVPFRLMARVPDQDQ